MTGYISYDDLNAELQEKIDKDGMYKIIAPLSSIVEYDDEKYDDGVSLFTLSYNSDATASTDAIAISWLDALYGEEHEGEYVFSVTTVKDDTGESPVVIQKVEIIKDGVGDKIAVRTVTEVGGGTYGWTTFSDLSSGGNQPPSAKFVRTVNLVLPDNDGNVNTSFQIIDTVEPWVLWNDDVYPDGVSEFITVWDKVKYADFIVENPSFSKLPEGRMMVRTHKMLTTGSRPEVWQEIDTSEDGIFHATFARLGQANGVWGELNADNANHVQHIDPLAPTASFDDYPNGVSIFAVVYDENDLSWYEALNLMPVNVYEEYAGHKPWGKVAVTSFKNKTLITQFIQVQDAFGEVSVVGRYYTKIENRWFGSNNRNNGVDGKVKKVNGISPDHLGNVNISGDGVVVVDNLTTDDGSKALSARQGKVLKDELDEHIDKVASKTELGHVKVKDESLELDSSGFLKVKTPIQYKVNGWESTPTDFDYGLSFRLPNTVAISVVENDFTRKLNQILGTEIDMSILDVEIEGLKGSDTRFQTNRVARQIVRFLNKQDNYRVVAVGECFSNADNTDWLDFNITLPLHSSKGNPNNISFKAILGSMYTDNETGKVYIKRGTTTTIDGQDWEEISSGNVEWEDF